MTAQIPGNAVDGDILTNTVRIRSDTAELNYDNNESSATSVVGDSANIYTMIDTPSTYVLSDGLNFSVWYGNNGNLVADDTVLTIQLPADVSYAGQFSGPISCSYVSANHSIECPIGSLSTNTDNRVDFSVMV